MAIPGDRHEICLLLEISLLPSCIYSKNKFYLENKISRAKKKNYFAGCSVAVDAASDLVSLRRARQKEKG